MSRGRSAGTGLGGSVRAGPFSFLALASPLGRVAAAFLIASNFAFLLAPLLYLVARLMAPTANLDPGDPSALALALASDPIGMFALGEALVVLGAALLTTSVVLVVLGLWRLRPAIPIDALGIGGVTVVAMAAWCVLAAVSATAARATTGIVAVAATGGWGAGALALLITSGLYSIFRIRAGADRTRARQLTSASWPLFAALNLVGSAVLASSVIDPHDVVLLLAGIGLQVVLIPFVGIVAYRDVGDGFARWPKLARASRPVPVEAPPTEDLGVFETVEVASEEPEVEALEPPPPEDLAEPSPPAA